MSAAIHVLDEDNLSPAELVAAFTAEELLLAATETSKQYEGIVLGRAIRIVLYRTGLNRIQLAQAMGACRSALYRHFKGIPTSPSQSMKVFLALLLAMEAHRDAAAH